ncbi:hypothetical protein JW905_16290 [bacterium]|nr:hypothetical protein [candidate division CSSED10-310 bacterium]
MMKKCMGSLVTISLAALVAVAGIMAEEIKETAMLKITGFAEHSAMREAGASIGDIIVTYNGSPVHSIEALGALKIAVESDVVEAGLLRAGESITISVPKGTLGVYLGVILPDHPRDGDAVVIDGIGKLGWGMNMENSFLGAMYRLDEKFGDHISYADLSGLSGYAFRVQFFDRWCPSSPDLTCGKNLAPGMFATLGYNGMSYLLKNEETPPEYDAMARSEDVLRTFIKQSIDRGWPVIALDLIEVPEWGIVTGYQKDGGELFCRSYFDHTENYDMAVKFPWMIYVMDSHEKKDMSEAYKKSLELALEMQETPKYGAYFSGETAVREWLRALKAERDLAGMKQERLEEALLANWWTMYSLGMARADAASYLRGNRDKFGVTPALIDELARLYEEESDLAKKAIEVIPSPHVEGAAWTRENRDAQIPIMKELLKLEKAAHKVLKKAAG